jgi:magnesium transporter
VTVTDKPVPALRALAERCHSRPELAQAAEGVLFYRVCDATIDSYFPVMDALDAEIDELETNIVERADASTVRDIFTLKHDLNMLRRVLGPQRDLIQGLAGPRGTRLGAETQLYLRDVYDHALRIVEELDTYRDLITGSLDVYLSSVSNRLGEQTRRLSVVATIFLPLTFFTGFFGQNFAFLVGEITSTEAFVIGMVAMGVSVAIIYVIIQRTTRAAPPLPPAPPRRATRNLLRISLAPRVSSPAHERPELHDAEHAARRQEQRDHRRHRLRPRP